jgi:transposase
MAKSQPSYTSEFKARMVELVHSGRSPEALSREFEPSVQTIWNWVAQAARDQGVRSDGLKTDEREELSRLRREVRTLKQEREILAKAASWFAQETEHGQKSSRS